MHTSHSKTKMISTRKNDNTLNTGARGTNQKHIYMTMQVTTPKLPARMLKNSSREPKAFARVKISAQSDISAAKMRRMSTIMS